MRRLRKHRHVLVHREEDLGKEAPCPGVLMMRGNLFRSIRLCNEAIIQNSNAPNHAINLHPVVEDRKRDQVLLRRIPPMGAKITSSKRGA
jgi:hypothetical protein